MHHFDEQLSEDLEFGIIRLMLHDYCIAESTRLKVVDLKPIADFRVLREELKHLTEFNKIKISGELFPAVDFAEITDEIEALRAMGGVLEEESFVKILDLRRMCNAVLHFFDKREKDFPSLVTLLEHVEYTTELIDAIEKVFDKRGKIKDDASPALASIRKNILGTKRELNRAFDKELKKMHGEGWLSDNGEAFVNDRRVLSVNSTHKRKIGGNTLGFSKTGSLTFIEPQNTIKHNNELENLRDDERKEIYRILKELTQRMRTNKDLLESSNALALKLDFINAKNKLALDLDATMPGLSEETEIELIRAFHPILLLSNKNAGVETLPQSIRMDKFSRMLVISGPNAGGKSITLKTVGLLQLMLQSGLLIPADSNSKMCFFHNVLTDIGDNQSIENQLSTYSYRLKRMKFFLEVANKRSLLLLDEFGTGSDPELGGALAEVFFETLYNKKCFGVITTHYANIKLKASKLKNAVNASMLFDRDTLQPLYKLSMGQPGSSFTFEVAQINGIDPELIEQAKSKLDGSRVKMDKLLATLQNEKSQFEKLNKTSADAQRKAEVAKLDFERRKAKFDEKSIAQQAVLENNNQYLHRGKKLAHFINQYQLKDKNKALLQEVNKYLAVEKTKILEAKKKLELKKREAAKKNKPKPNSNQNNIVVGSTVKLKKTRQTGTVLALDGNKATVAFGSMKTKAELNMLVWIR